MRCKHKNKTVWCWSNHAQPPQWYNRYKPVRGCLRYAHCDAVTCDDCHAWLPLGPATDDERTSVEVRAAEIAAGHVGAPFVGGGLGFNIRRMPYAEWCGFEHSGYPDVGGATTDRMVRDYESGYLARCIAEHEEPKPLTLDDVREALAKGAEERKTAERMMKRSPRR